MLIRRGVPDHEHADLVGAAAEPAELGRVERDVGSPPISGSIAMPRLKMPMVGAVLRRDVVEIIGELERARARHVLHHDRRIARDMPAEMAGEDAGVGVIAAAGAIADDQVEVLAAIEVGDRVLRASRLRQRQQDKNQGERTAHGGCSVLRAGPYTRSLKMSGPR